MNKDRAPEPTGLSTIEAAARLNGEGPNEIPAVGQRSVLQVVFDVLSEPMFFLLLAASVIYLVLGELAEAIALTAFATLSVSIGLVQELRSERVLAALRDMTSPRALVVRDGVQKRIPGRDVVRGDLIMLAEGDRVPADSWVVTGFDLTADESLLTGESVPVRKRAQTTIEPTTLRPGGDDLPCVYSGTLIVRGHGSALVTATGPRSEIGKIGSALGRIRVESPRLQQETRRVVRVFAVVGLAVSLAAGLLYGMTSGSWLNGLLAGIAVGMSMLPEEFPLVLAVFMVMGAWRIAQARVLTRRAASIESLGAVTVLCTDKTGTLTENRMSLAHAEAGGEFWTPATPALTTGLSALLSVGALAGLREPFDPMERALQDIWRVTDPELTALFSTRELKEHQGLTPAHLVMTQIWHERDTGHFVAAAKGAPEAVAQLCALPSDQSSAMLLRTNDLARQGLRVLAVAVSADGPQTLIEGSRQFKFLGLVGFQDPLRASVPQAVEECHRAGIRVVMITGDYPATARTIAEKAGINANEVLSGEELQGLSEAELRLRVSNCDVYARVMPEQKLRIVEALKANGEVVGMTGDGVNDAPSLRAAHIGIAMGGRGTDVAREASSIVLLDDDFGSIVKTVRLGRRIYDNLRKAMGYILAVHVPIAGLALLPLVFGGPLILTPTLIAFLEMIIDPACSVVFEAEPEERDVMDRPPRDPKASLLERSIVWWSLLQGLLALIAVAAVFVIARQSNVAEPDLRALMLVSLVVTNFALIFTHRSRRGSLGEVFNRSNPWLWFGGAAVAGVLTLVLAVPFLRDLFRLGPLHVDDLTLVGGAVIGMLVVIFGLGRLNAAAVK